MATAVGARYIWSFITDTDFFELKSESVTITGNNMISENTLLSHLNLTYGKNILTYNLKEKSGRLEELDRVKEARVKRNFPDGLFINIREVEPSGYSFIGDKRCVVTRCGHIFPGPEGPPLKFIFTDRENIIRISDFLETVKSLNKNFYNSIIAVDLNYREDIIIHTLQTRLLWPPAEKLNKESIKRKINVYMTFASGEKEVESLDFRFLSVSGGRLKGSVIAKK